MVSDAEKVRDGRPVLTLARNDTASVARLTGWVRHVLAAHLGGRHVPQDPGSPAPHTHP